jgi:hypothetical protein
LPATKQLRLFVSRETKKTFQFRALCDMTENSELT